MSIRAHTVSVRSLGRTIDQWTRYRIDTDMLAPADSFSLELGPITQELYEYVPTDAEVEVWIDDTKILTGYVDQRTRRGSRAGDTLEIQGRDKGGRLVDESMELTSFANLDLRQLAESVAGEWFESVTFSNASNRALVRGKRARKAASNQEPAIVFDRSKAPKKVEPGETRWQVLLNWLEPAGLLAWSTADGSALVIGEPNYDQQPQYAFFAPAPGSTRAHLGNVLEWQHIESVADRYSQITVLGETRGDSANYGRNVLKSAGVAKNGTGAGGIGADFDQAKRLIISDGEVKSQRDATDRAERELARRDAAGETLTLTVPGHSQQLARRANPAQYAFDTICTFEDELLAIRGRYLITACTFTADKSAGEMTNLTLVPEGTVLTQ